jgi:hypothetical protein
MLFRPTYQVYDWLGVQTRNRGAADVLDFLDPLPNCLKETVAFLCKESGPRWIVRYDIHRLYRHDSECTATGCFREPVHRKLSFREDYS